MRIYLDNNATTAIHPEVLEALSENLRNVYGNASSIHQEGQSARRTIEEAREAVAGLLGATPREIVFTSGGTESNNAAIYGVAGTDDRVHIVTTSIEHPSVAEPLAGRNVTWVAVGRSGRVDAAAVIDALRPDTRLVTVMLANNETGVIQPVSEIARACRDRGIHIHCDAVQAAGKVGIAVEELGVDTLSVSAHKLHAPKGIGALYVRKGAPALTPQLLGGAQERRRRAGTENVPLAAAFGSAATLANDSAMWRRVTALRDAFEAALPGVVTINGAGVARVPNTSNVTFHGADGEGIVIALDLRGVAVSTGSACSSGRVEPSRTLLAMGLSPAEARSTVRFSLSRFTSGEEIGQVVRLLAELVPRCTVSPIQA
jgi:cysteine desulfurase